jgi:hypothetical protein
MAQGATISGLEPLFHRVVTPGTDGRCSGVSLPTAQCNHNRHMPRVLFRCGRGNCGGRARPARDEDRSTPASRGALPVEASDNSRPQPIGPSDPRKDGPPACCADIRFPRQIRAQEFRFLWLPAGRDGDLVSRRLGLGIASEFDAADMPGTTRGERFRH